MTIVPLFHDCLYVCRFHGSIWLSCCNHFSGAWKEAKKTIFEIISFYGPIWSFLWIFSFVYLFCKRVTSWSSHIVFYCLFHACLCVLNITCMHTLASLGRKGKEERFQVWPTCVYQQVSKREKRPCFSPVAWEPVENLSTTSPCADIRAPHRHLTCVLR